MLAAIALLVIGINYLKGGNLFSRTSTFYGVYDHVSGLTPNNPVLVNGFRVGQVTDIELFDQRKGNVLVTFSVDQKKFNFPSDTEARIQSTDLLGSKSLVLKLGQSQTMASSGDTLSVGIETDLMNAVSEEMRPIKLKTEKLLGTIDSVMTVTEELLRVDAKPNLSKSFESIRRTLESLENTSSNLDGLLSSEKGRLGNIFQNLESITANFAKNNDKLGNTISNFSSISDSLVSADIGGVVIDAAKAVDQVASIMEQINSGNGSLGLLLYNDSLYTNLASASDNLDLLMEDMRLNPKRYVQFSMFGKKQQYQLTTKDKEEIIEKIKN